MPDEDENFGVSLVLDFRTCWRHVQAKNWLLVVNYLLVRNFLADEISDWLADWLTDCLTDWLPYSLNKTLHTCEAILGYFL